MMKYIFWLLFLSVTASSCIEQPNSFPMLPPGEWRGILKLTDPDKVKLPSIDGEEEKVIDYFELPFNMVVEYEGESMKVYLLNGEERIAIEEVHYGRDPSTAKDTLQMDMAAFDTSLQGFYEENIVEGYWVVNYKKNYRIPFIAIYGQNHRFINEPVSGTKDFSGKWKVIFEYDSDDAYPALAEFNQDKNKLDGTFLTETGDYRYLSGNAYGDKMRLSVFDGSHAFLFSGSLQQDTIYGEFRSGKHYKSKWYAVRDEQFTLANPYDMTKSQENGSVTFSFPDETGKEISVSKPGSGSKVKLINIMGTWCPNCKDEALYLKELRKKYNADIELYSIAFERYKKASEAQAVLRKYKSVVGIDWPLLLGGYADKKKTAETFPFLDKIYSYPTLLVLDQQNKVRHIHTGFSGPATSVYDSFKIDFEKRLDLIISE